MCSALISKKLKEFLIFRCLKYSPFSNRLCHSSIAQGENVKKLIPPGLLRSSFISFSPFRSHLRL